MREIKLSNSPLVAIVDDEDFDNINQWVWRLTEDGYARRNKSQKNMLMHREIIGAQPGEEVDHKNRNKLDNRRDNLRIATRSINCFNKDLTRSNTSGAKGVHWHKINKTWVAYIKINQKLKHLGCSKDKEVAIQLRKQAEVKYGVAI